MNYTSMLNRFNDIVDCRTIAMHMDFFLLGNEEAMELRRFLYNRIKYLYDESFVCKWTWDDRCRSLSFIDEMIDDYNFGSVGCDAFVKSDRIQNMRDFRAMERALLRLYPIEGLSECSVDYPDEMKPYWDRILSPETCKEALREVYNLPRKVNMNYWRKCDSSFSILIPGVIPFPHFYIKYPNSICGSADFYIALNAVENPKELTDYLIDVLKKAQSITPSFNACISLASEDWVNKGCFMENDDECRKVDIRTGLTKEELDSFYYVNYYGWYNIFSPIIAERISYLHGLKQENGIAVTSLNSGAIEINFKDDIREFDIDEAMRIKKLLYPVIRPGESYIEYEFFANAAFVRDGLGPRRTWDLMPVLDDEIVIEKERCILRYQNSVKSECNLYSLV